MNALEKLKRRMAEEKWYGSREHFRTEKSYEEHIIDLKRRKQTPRQALLVKKLKKYI
jgi:hypothetical protein